MIAIPSMTACYEIQQRGCLCGFWAAYARHTAITWLAQNALLLVFEILAILTTAATMALFGVFKLHKFTLIKRHYFTV